MWVVRKRDVGYDILLQKRSMEKESFPGLYDTSSAGHIPAGSLYRGSGICFDEGYNGRQASVCTFGRRGGAAEIVDSML